VTGVLPHAFGASGQSDKGESKMAEADEKKGKDLALLVYILQAVGFFIGLTWIVGVIVNYVKRDDVRGTWVESHFDWQIKTFWIGLAGWFVGVITVWILVGWLILLAVTVWAIYRVVKGWLALTDAKPLGTGFF
jgi:uncharacterized membrane protein